MALIKLPVRSDIPKYEFRVDLDNATYTLNFRFNRRQDRWIMDFKTENNLPLVMGVPLLIGTSLLARFVVDGLPEGDLFVVNLEDDFVDAGRDDLGENIILFYSEAA